jgi:hypothetical protein
MSALQAMAVLFKRELDGHQTIFALGESLAHLHLLWYQNEFERIDGPLIRFKPTEVKPRH